MSVRARVKGKCREVGNDDIYLFIFEAVWS